MVQVLAEPFVNLMPANEYKIIYIYMYTVNNNMYVIHIL